jgi:hypothetical protein
MKSKENCPQKNTKYTPNLIFFLFKNGILVVCFHHVLKLFLSYKTKKMPIIMDDIFNFLHVLMMIIQSQSSKLSRSKVCCKCFIYINKVIDTRMTTQLVGLRHYCMDANDSTTHTCTHAFSSNNWIMLAWSNILHVVGWFAMPKSKLLLRHWIWASSEPQMVAIGKDKASTPCSNFENID